MYICMYPCMSAIICMRRTLSENSTEQLGRSAFNLQGKVSDFLGGAAFVGRYQLPRSYPSKSRSVNSDRRRINDIFLNAIWTRVKMESKVGQPIRSNSTVPKPTVPTLFLHFCVDKCPLTSQVVNRVVFFGPITTLIDCSYGYCGLGFPSAHSH